MSIYDAGQIIQLRRLITPAERGQYIELPFTMPDGVDELAVRLQVEHTGAGEVAVDLGVRDPARTRGWSGIARDAFVIGQDAATPGYLAGSLHAGPWALILGAYKIPPAGGAVTAEVTLRPQQPRWLRGDLHLHTVHSDGVYTFTEVRQKVQALRLDFIGLTDHNTSSQNRVYSDDPTLLLIPGMELTTYKGHCNLFGVRDPLDDWRAATPDELRARLAQARERGARIAINHPFEDLCEGCVWEWGWDIPYDWVEVWNGPWRANNQRTLAWWARQLAAGQRLVAVGGSDTHGPHQWVRHGMPTNWVYSRSHSVAGILETIAAGHVFLSFSPEGPRLDLTCGAAMMGDLVPRASDDPVVARAAGLQLGDSVRLLSERGIAQQAVAREADGGEIELRMARSSDGPRFVRLEVWRHFTEVDATLLAAMSNPIYFG
jgi:hypothetical protein